MNKKITMIVLSAIFGICILLFGYTYIKYTNIVKLNNNLKEEIKKIDNDNNKLQDSVNDINDYISKPFGNETKVEKTLPTVYDIVAQEKVKKGTTDLRPDTQVTQAVGNSFSDNNIPQTNKVHSIILH